MLSLKFYFFYDTWEKVGSGAKETFLFLTQNNFGYALGSSFAVNNKERKKKKLIYAFISRFK